MKIHLNGEDTEIRDGILVSELVEDFGYRPERIAVEVNYEIVPKQNYGSVRLQQDDHIEIVGFMGGG